MTERESAIIVNVDDGPLSIEHLDASWSAARGVGTKDPAARLFLNLNPVSFIHVEALMMLVAILVDRARRGLKTEIELPASKDVLNALRSLDFARTIQQATGSDLDTFLTRGSQIRFQNRDPSDSPWASYRATPDGGEQMLLPSSFFALRKVEVKQDPEIAAEIARIPYHDKHLVEILNDVLKEDSRRIGSFLVREAIKNAASHPNASVAYTTMQIRKNEVSIVVWDDGDSFSSTFAEAYSKVPIKSLAYGKASDKIRTWFTDQDYPANSRPIDFDSKTDDPSTREEFIPFAFVMGSSSTAEVVYARDEEERKDLGAYVSEDLIPYSGIGLHVIRKCVIDVFGGSIHYSAGGYRFTLRRPLNSKSDDYRGWLTLRRETRSQLAGNLLVFKLPIRKSTRRTARA